MQEIGRIQKLIIERFVDFGAYLSSPLGEILIPSKYLPRGTKHGDELEVFIYTDSEDRLIATTLKPLAQRGDFAALVVKQVTTFGAFLDWGLEKDLLVPKSEMDVPMEEDEIYVVHVYLDERTNRLVGSARLDRFLQKAPENYSNGQEVKILLYKKTDLGIKVVVDNLYDGMIYHDEIFQDTSRGMELKAYVTKRREDGKLDIRINPSGYVNLLSEKDVLLNRLKEKGGKLLLGDKSSAEEIYAEFKMSKKNFKKLIGRLYRERLIEMDEKSIWLL